MGVVTEYFS